MEARREIGALKTNAEGIGNQSVDIKKGEQNKKDGDIPSL